MTAIFGDYDEIRDPVVVTPGWRYVCFSDKYVKSDIWETIQPEQKWFDQWFGVHRQTAKKKAGLCMMMPFAHMNYENIVNVSGRTEVGCDLDWLLDIYGPKHHMSVMDHPSRTCVYEEAYACKQLNKDLPSTINSQMLKYKKEGYPTHNGMIASGLMIRRNTWKVGGLMSLWWNEVLHHSKRDQLSFNYALWKWNNTTNAAWRLDYDRIPWRVIETRFRLFGHGVKGKYTD